MPPLKRNHIRLKASNRLSRAKPTQWIERVNTGLSWNLRGWTGVVVLAAARKKEAWIQTPKADLFNAMSGLAQGVRE
jgi:hypothetical protein